MPGRCIHLTVPALNLLLFLRIGGGVDVGSIPVISPSTIHHSTLPASRTLLTANSSLAVGGAAEVYKPWVAKLPSGELLVVAFCAMGFGSGQCHFPNGTAAEHALFWRSRDNGVSWSAGEARQDLLGREFSLSVLRDGTLLMPSADLDCNPGCGYPSRLSRSTDSGKSFSTIGLRLPGVAWDHTGSDRTVIEIGDKTLLGLSCRGDYTKPAPCAKDDSSYWISSDSGGTWSIGGKDPSAGPVGTLAHPDTQGWDDGDGFFGESTTLVLRDNRTLLHAGRLGTVYNTSWKPPGFDEYDGMFAGRSTDGGKHWSFLGCRDGAADCSIPCEHGPHPQCAGLPSFGTVGEMYPRFLELRDGRVLLTFTVRCGQTPLPPVGGMYWCNDTRDGHGLGLRAVLSTDQGKTFSFDHDRIVLMEQPFFASVQPSGGGYGNTVETQDGSLVTVGSWRDASGAIHSEAVRWRLTARNITPAGNSSNSTRQTVTRGRVVLHPPSLMGSEITVPTRSGHGTVTLQNNESWGIESSFSLSPTNGVLISPQGRTSWPEWSYPGSTPLLVSNDSGRHWEQTGRILCYTNSSRTTCGLQPAVRTGLSTVHSVWSGQLLPCEGPRCTGANITAPVTDHKTVDSRTRSTDWRSFQSGPLLEFTYSKGDVHVNTISRNATFSNLPYPTLANCDFDARGYSYMAKERTGMKLTACATVEMADGTFLLTAGVCWDTRITLAAYGGVAPASLVAFRSTNGFDWEYTTIIANASWYMGPDELQPPMYPNDPIRPGITTSGGWINQTIQFGPSENDLVLLADGKTLMAVIRMDANDRCGNARHKGVWPPSTDTAYQYYHQAFSTDNGKSFSKPKPIMGAGCVRPRLLLLAPQGPLLMSGGRNCVDETIDISLWVNDDGMGKEWQEVSITGVHNALLPEALREYRFSAEVNNSQGNIFAETNSYTNLLPLGEDKAVLLYMREWPKPGWVHGKPDPSFQEPSTGFSILITPRAGPPQPSPPAPPPTPPPTPPTPSGLELVADFDIFGGIADRQSSAIQQEIFVNDTTPTDMQLKELQLVRYRGHGCTTPEYYQRLVRIGVREMHYILADDPVWAGNDPSSDLSKWESFVTETVTRARAHNMTRIMWEPWNEGDLTWFGGAKPRTLESFWLMWKVAVRAVRKAAAQGSIVGPSFSCSQWSKHCDPKNESSAFAQFLEMAKSEDVMPDVLAWHEWAPRGDIVPEHVAAVRASMAAHSMPEPNICINEIVQGSFQACQVGHPSPANDEYFEPGAMVAWFANIANATVSSGFSHWDGPDTSCVLDGSLTCFKKSSNDGNAKAGAPRATWWVRLAYASLSVGKYFVATSSSQVAMLGAYDGSGCTGMLIGAAKNSSAARLTLHHVPPTLVNDGSSIFVRSYKIPFNPPGCDVVEQPQGHEAVASVSSSRTASMELPIMTKGDAVYMQLGHECIAPW